MKPSRFRHKNDMIFADYVREFSNSPSRLFGGDGCVMLQGKIEVRKRW